MSTETIRLIREGRGGGGGGGRRLYTYRYTVITSEPVWPSGKALGWKAEGARFESARLSFLFESFGLWTLSCDFDPHS